MTNIWQSIYKLRWFYFNFDRMFVTCLHCSTRYVYADVKRKNKCPNCKVDNHLHGGHIPDKDTL